MSSKTTKFESLLEAVPDALVGMDQAGVIQFVNHQTESLSISAQRFAAMPSLGWPRACRSGDLVRAEPQGLVGRAGCC
jgi:hypothetical protein